MLHSLIPSNREPGGGVPMSSPEGPHHATRMGLSIMPREGMAIHSFGCRARQKARVASRKGIL